jgi:hypothetical protein
VKPPKYALNTTPEAAKFSLATRNEKSVPKKPLASCMMLVATMSVAICVRGDPFAAI